MADTSFLYKSQGIYDPTKRYAFKNITDAPFTFSWGGKNITVKAGESIEVPEHYAVVATKKLVDQIMLEEVRVEETKMRAELRDPFWRSPKGIALAVPNARKPYEEKIIRELAFDEENPQTQVMRAQIKEQILNDLSNGQKAAPPITDAIGSINIPGNGVLPTEFADIPKS